MKQFCPKYGEWYDVYSNVCPKCDVFTYDEDEYYDSIENNEALKIISVGFVNGLNNWGWLILVGGIIGTVVSTIFSSSAKTILGTWIIPIVCAVILIAGIILIRTSSKLCKGKKLSELPDNQYVQCPYCHSRKVSKLTTLDRAGSIIIAGAASGKIGKQWHCNNCGSNF